MLFKYKEEYLFEDIDGLLMLIPRRTKVFRDKVYFVAEYPENPRFGKDWISTPLNFYFESDRVTPQNRAATKLPVYNYHGDYSFQLYLSEYVINSFIETAFEENLLHFQVDATTTSDWGLVTLKIPHHFGHGKPC